jgi:hypothetical protein
MAFSIKLVRRPRSVKRATAAVQKEVRTAYEELARTSISKLDKNVSDKDSCASLVL